MNNLLKVCVLAGAVIVFAGCSSRPISKTYQAVKRAYHTTGKVYRTTKAVAELVNPLEYIYLSEQSGERPGLLETPGGGSEWVYDAQSGQIVLRDTALQP